MCTSPGAFGNPGGPSNANCQKINENWQLYLIMQPSAMCLHQTFFFWRVIILSTPIWVRLCCGNWFWILDPLLFEVLSGILSHVCASGLSNTCQRDTFWRGTNSVLLVTILRWERWGARQVWNAGHTCLGLWKPAKRSWVLPHAHLCFLFRVLSGIIILQVTQWLLYFLFLLCPVMPIVTQYSTTWLSEAYKLYILSIKSYFQTLLPKT